MKLPAIPCPHCGGDLGVHLASLWGRWRSLHNRKKTGFAAMSEEQRRVQGQKGAEKRWGKKTQ